MFVDFFLILTKIHVAWNHIHIHVKLCPGLDFTFASWARRVLSWSYTLHNISYTSFTYISESYDDDDEYDNNNDDDDDDEDDDDDGDDDDDDDDLPYKSTVESA